MSGHPSAAHRVGLLKRRRKTPRRHREHEELLQSVRGLAVFALKPPDPTRCRRPPRAEQPATVAENLPQWSASANLNETKESVSIDCMEDFMFGVHDDVGPEEQRNRGSRSVGLHFRLARLRRRSSEAPAT